MGLKNDFYFKVLKKLSLGIHKSIDISDITRDYFSNQENTNNVNWLDVDEEINIYFDAMLKSGHIKEFINKTPKGLGFLSSRNYLPKINVEATISTSGYAFYKLHKSTIMTKIISVVALVFSFIALVFNGYNTFKNRYDKPLEKQQKTSQGKSEYHPKLKKQE